MLHLRYCKLESTYPKKEGSSGLCREEALKTDAAPSGSLPVRAATTSMAIAAAGLSLAERDRLGLLRQENKASWRKVAQLWPEVASPAHSEGRRSLLGGVAAGRWVSAAQNLQSWRHDFQESRWRGRTGRRRDPGYLPPGSFPRVGSFSPSRWRNPGRV